MKNPGPNEKYWYKRDLATYLYGPIVYQTISTKLYSYLCRPPQVACIFEALSIARSNRLSSVPYVFGMPALSRSLYSQDQ